ncbi:MAG: hypothetical protein EBS38_07020 [Actinobacteria bacterium]|nr:hypothetical protein [Actinomycetota bacterium]
MRKKRWPLITAGVLLVAVGASFAIAPMLTTQPEYETYEVKSTAVTKTVSANGQLAETELLSYGPAEQPSLVSVNGSIEQPVQFGASLEIDSIAVELGDRVNAEDPLFTYIDQLGREIEVVATSDGVVRSIDTAAGLRTSGSVLTVGSDKPIVSVFVSEYDADLVKLDQVANIELDAISAAFDGVVVGIGQVAQSVSGIKQYEVLLEVSDLPEGARFGMSATAEIEVLTKKDVLAIPLNALVGDEQTQIDILRLDAEGRQSVERIDVELGIFGDSFAEVLTGVSAGDQVIVGVSGSIPAPVNFGPPRGARESG